MYDHFGLSGDEELLYSEQILPEGFKVDITLPDRITNEEIADYFHHTLPSIYLCGMNRDVGKTVVIVKIRTVNTWTVCFNRGLV